MMRNKNITYRRIKTGKRWISLSLAISFYLSGIVTSFAAAITPRGGVALSTASNGAAVVEIEGPNDKGLSRNRFDTFNVDEKGIVFNNNARQEAAVTKLAGAISSNRNFSGNAARTILVETLGKDSTRLQGMMEIAGSRADLIIANPNGITGNGFGFINVGRATLAAGRPVVENGTLSGFDLTGTISVEGKGNTPVYDDKGGILYGRADKLDIYSRAAAINSALFAKDDIHVTVGQGRVHYDTGTMEAVKENDEKGLSLDIGALGGMYAGSIYLVGTAAGMGVNVGGTIHASKDLVLTNEGKIELKSHDIAGEDGDTDTTSITSDGTISITSAKGSIDSSMDMMARKDIHLSAAGAITNTGRISAGESYEETEGSGQFKTDSASLAIKGGSLENRGTLSASDNISLVVRDNAELGGGLEAGNNMTGEAGGSIHLSGALSADKGTISLTGERITGSRDNLKAKDEKSLVLVERNPVRPEEKPDPETPRKAEDLKTPSLPSMPDTADTVKADKAEDRDLPLTADETAPGKYKPIIDHAANGVDLVQIAEADGNGVSRNLYHDFNVKQRGLILNNASRYTKTDLGGYIDRNMKIYGKGARLVLNEVTGHTESRLMGYIEVAGSPASLVIANPNGISVNGTGFLHVKDVTLAAAPISSMENGYIRFGHGMGDIRLMGDGLNGREAENLSLYGRSIHNDRSELYGKNIKLTAEDTITNTGKTGAEEDVTLSAKNLENKEKGILEAKGNMHISLAESLTQHQSALKAGKNLFLTASSLSQDENALLSSAGDMDIHSTSLDNRHGSMTAGGNLTLDTETLKNSDSGLLHGEQKVDIRAVSFSNDGASLYGNKDVTIKADTLENKNSSLLHAGRNSSITVGNFTNSHGSMDVQGDLKARADAFTNEDSAYLGVGGDMTLTGRDFINQSLGGVYVTGNLSLSEEGNMTNEDGLLAAGKGLAIEAENLYNRNDSGYKEGSLLSSGDSMHLTARHILHNRSSTIESGKDMTVEAEDLINDKETMKTGWQVTYEDIAYRIPHLQEKNYYDARREFKRTIHTGVIEEETNDSRMMAEGSLTIQARNEIHNDYSTMAAAGNLSVTAGRDIENTGYQGTIHYDDLGHDNHYWKYKKHTRMHLHCHMVYGKTVPPYENHEVHDETGDDTKRLSVMSGNGKTTIQSLHGSVQNRTLEADGKVYENRDKKADLKKENPLDGKRASENNPAYNNEALSSLEKESRLYTLTRDPSARYLYETDPRYADYRNFLSSDYLLERVKADPEKVSKKLGDGWIEQRLVQEQLLALTGNPYLSGTGSSMETFKKLMDNGVTQAETLHLSIGVELSKEQTAALTSDILWLVKEKVNGEDVLVPKIYLARLSEKDITPKGAVITGSDVEIYSGKTLKNLGTLHGGHTLSLAAHTIENREGAITGNRIHMKADGDIVNRSGTISARDSLSLEAGNITNETAKREDRSRGLYQSSLGNTARMEAGKDMTLSAKDSIQNRGGSLTAGETLAMEAGKDISMEALSREKHVAVTFSDSAAEIHERKYTEAEVSAKNFSLIAGNTITLSGASIKADDKADMTAGKDIRLTAEKDLYAEDASVGKRKGSYYQRLKTEDEAVKGTLISSAGEVRLKAGKDISLKGSGITSEKGKISLTAGEDISMMDEKEHHEIIHEYHSHVSGLLSSKTKDLYEAGTTDTVRGSLIFGNETHMESGRDMTITGSAVVSDEDTTLLAGRNFKADSAEERSGSTYRESVKKRGLLSEGGLGFTMGSEKRKDRSDSEAVEQVGSTIGSVEGSVRIGAGKDADIEASRVSAGKDLAVRGKNVTITSKDNVYTNKEEHEYKRSGLSVSLGGSFVSGVNSVIQPLQKSGDVQDGRLKNLYMADAGMNGRTAIRNFDSAGKIKAGLAVDVGFSSVSSTSKASSHETQAQSSTLTAKEKADIRSGENLSIHGSTIQGKDVDLEAGKDILMTAAENRSEMDIHEKTKNGGISTSWGIGGLSGVKVYGQSAKGMENAASLTHTASEVSAENTLHVSGGNDTIMTGSRMEGGKVVLATGGSLRIESLQDTESYKSRSNVKGGALASDVFKDSAGHKKLDKPYLSAETARGYTDSDYASVKEQAGIYAGQEGYDISVKDNTHLKGAVIDSKGSVDKNTLRTGTLSWEDIENKADYTSGGSGISYTAKLGGNVNNDTPSSRENSRYDKESGTNTHNESDKVIGTFDGNRIPLNERGLLGVPSAATKGKADSTTRAAMAPGKIIITDTKNQKQDVTGLDRNTRDSLNKLKTIFDKTKAEERKQLVEEMSIVGNEAIHELAARNGWGEGSIEKTALHGLLGAMTSKAAGSSALAGILSGGVQEYAMGYLHNHMPKGWAANHPDEAQMIAAGLGMIVGSISNDKKIGGYIAQMGAKWNEEYTIEELADILFSDDKATFFLQQRGIPVTGENIRQMKESFIRFFESYKSADAIIAIGSVGGTVSGEIDFIYDLKAQSLDNKYLSAGINSGEAISPLNFSFAAIRIIPNADDSEMREMLKDSSVRNDILSGIGVSGAIYVGVGGGIMIPSSSEYVNRIKIYVVGVGTPQIGFGIGLAQSMKEKEERMRSEISDGTIIE